MDHLNGMFAFCVWDERTRTLLLGRDRVGEKPLYYWWNDGQLVFGSELRAILAHPDAPRAVDPVALRRYLLHDYFPAPLSPIAGIRKLPAGHVLTVRDGQLAVRCYWDLADHFNQPEIAAMTPAAIADEVDRRMAKAVERRRRADVPVGVFLSGGIDSSAVLAHLADQIGPGVPAFSLGHTDLNFDESRFARETARFFKADFNELVLTEDDLADGLRRVAVGFDEPLGDASIIPTHLLSLFAVQKVKVVLSGEGADELFAGYPTYIGNRVAGWYRRMPGPVRRSLVAGIRKVLPVSMGNVSPDYLLSRFSAAAERELVERHHTWFGSLRPERHPEILSGPVMAMLATDDPFGSARARVRGQEPPGSAGDPALLGFHHVPPGRPPDQGRSGDHARLAGGPNPVSRSRLRRVRRRHPVQSQAPGNHDQGDPQAGGQETAAAGGAEAPQARLQHPVLTMVAARSRRTAPRTILRREGRGARPPRPRRDDPPHRRAHESPDRSPQTAVLAARPRSLVRRHLW